MIDIPVVLMTYKRPWHTAQVLKSLLAHDVRNIYIFSDAPKTQNDVQAVEQTRQLFNSVRWIEPKIIYRQENMGLARSIISAVNYVFQREERLILLEDDCVPQEHFFDFMDKCLTKYENNDKVFGISGYSIPYPKEMLKQYQHDVYFCPRIGSWGWATWKSSWQHFDTDLLGLYNKAIAQNIDLEQGGDDIPAQIHRMLNNQIDAWTLNWLVAVYLQGGCYVYPTVSHIDNIGFDGTGVHCGYTRRYDTVISETPSLSLPLEATVDTDMLEYFKSFYNVKKKKANSVTANSLPKPDPQQNARCENKLVITHMNTHDAAGGAAKVGWRLTEAQLKAGHDARMLVGNKKTNWDRSFAFDTGCDMTKIEYCRTNGKLYYEYEGSYKLIDHPLVKSSDILNLHNLHGYYFNPFSLSALSNAKPVVWTLHDMQPFTGHCAYSLECDKWLTGCQNCQALDVSPELPVDTARQLLKDKKLVYDNSNLHLVAPSQWLKNDIEKSILGNHPVELIYNGIDTNIFKPYDKQQIRAKYGIPAGAVVIGAVANGSVMKNSFKGGQYAVAALNELQKRLPGCVFVNVGGKELSRDGMVINIPKITDETELAQVYSMMDIFLYTPLADNCPLVVLEALACGLPIVTFDIGGVAELVINNHNGFVAEFKDVVGLVQGVEKLVKDTVIRNAFSNNCRQSALTRFNHDITAQKYERLYRRVLQQSKEQTKQIKRFVLSDVPQEIKTDAFIKAEETKTTQNVNTVSVNSYTGDPSKVDVSFVLATKDRAPLLDRMLESLKKATVGINFELIIIEGGSSDNTLEVLKKHGVTQIYNEAENFGPDRHSWPQLYNFGFAKARGKWAMYASDDIILAENCISNAVKQLDKQNEKVAGGIFFYLNKITRPDWDQFGIDFTIGDKMMVNYGLFRLEDYHKVGGLNESYKFYCADSELSLKLYDLGKELIPLPGCFVVHDNVLDELKKGNSQKADNDIALFKSRWKDRTSIERPNPQRLLWDENLTDLYNISLELPEITSGLQHLWHGLASLQYGMYEQAKIKFLQALQDGCVHWRVLWLIAQSAFKGGDLPVAEKAAKSVLKFKPEFAPANELLLEMGFSESGSAAVIFSKDRAAQLAAAIDSFKLHCKDSDDVTLNILYKTTSQRHQSQYDKLIAEHEDVRFVKEINFKQQLIGVVNSREHILFMVDDNVFVADFKMSDVLKALKADNRAIGFSLRVGTNTQYSYARDVQVALPGFERISENILRFNWTTSQSHFGYPLELSSSVYRTKDLLPLLNAIEFGNPNILEGMIEANKNFYAQSNERLLCFETSVAFCNPANIVQTVCDNRAGKNSLYSADELAKKFDEGLRIDVRKYSGFVPNSCHQEVELKFKKQFSGAAQPLVTIEMITYNAQDTIACALESVLAQTYQNFELLVVDDGSADATAQIVKSYHDPRIRYMLKEHNGRWAGTNFAIEHAKGEFLLAVDSDDFIAPDYLETMVDFAIQNPQADYYYPQVFELVDQAGNITGDKWSYMDFSDNTILPNYLFEALSSPIPYPGSLRRMSMFQRTGKYRELENVADFVFLCDNATKMRFKPVPNRPAYFYRSYGQSLSHRIEIRNKNMASALNDMIATYPAEILCPKIAGITDQGQKQQQYYKYLAEIFDRHVNGHMVQFGQYFKHFADIYRSKMIDASVDINRAATSALGAETPKNLFTRGVSLLKAAQPASAIEYFNRAQQTAPDLTEINYAKAIAFAQLGKIEQAQDACRAELRLNAMHAAAAEFLDKLAVSVST